MSANRTRVRDRFVNDECIIVAEDSPPSRTILALLLRRLGFKVLECEDGQIAWDLMQNQRDQNIIAVVSDMIMPNMDGLALLRKTRGDVRFRELPFVFVTAVSEKDYISEANKLQVNGYILKPVTGQRVARKIQELFPGKSFPAMVG